MAIFSNPLIKGWFENENNKKLKKEEKLFLFLKFNATLAP